MSTNVAFYSDAIATGQRYGLGRYAWELFSELRRSSPGCHVRPVAAHGPLDQSAQEKMKADFGFVALPWERRWLAATWSLIGAPALERWTPWADIVHCVELDYRVVTRKPLAVTIHDLGPLTHPQYFQNSHPWLLSCALRSAVRRADAIMCVSQTTADAVEGYLKQSLGDRLRIIPEGVAAEFFQPVPDHALIQTADFIKTGQPFFLWAGSLNPRKNLARVVAAYEQVSSEIPHHLVLTGGIGWDADHTLERIEKSPVRHRIHLPGRVSDLELRGLYQRASAFIYASLMEGFGLPILEAMASQCPVITSNISSMPEVAGDAAFLVDPHNTETMAAAMHCLATDRRFTAQLRHKGRARVEDFRWDTCAHEVGLVYNQIARSAPRGHKHKLFAARNRLNLGTPAAPAE